MVGAGYIYDNELLDAHFMAGDGRVNENIALTAVHHMFHAEHNRLRSTAYQGRDPGQRRSDLRRPVAAVARRVGRRAPVPGGEIRHRDAVPASGVRGVRPQSPAANRRIPGRRPRLRYNDQPVHRRRVRTHGVSLRALDAARNRRSLRPQLRLQRDRPDHGLPQPAGV